MCQESKIFTGCLKNTCRTMFAKKASIKLMMALDQGNVYYFTSNFFDSKQCWGGKYPSLNRVNSADSCSNNKIKHLLICKQFFLMRCRHEKVEHINSQEALYASSSLQGKTFHDPLLPSTALTSELHSKQE